MPNYDVECSACGHTDVIALKIAALSQWDTGACCPGCGAGSMQFHRVIKRAPTSKQARFASSQATDDMRHKQLGRINHDQVAAARESAEKGTYENF